MRFDRHRRAVDAHTLDDIGVDGPLPQQFHTRDLFRFFLEDLDKKPADSLPLGLRVRFARKLPIEKGLGVYSFYIQADLAVGLQLLRELVLAQHAVIYENAIQTVTYRLVDQGCRYRGIHTAAQRH